MRRLTILTAPFGPLAARGGYHLPHGHATSHGHGLVSWLAAHFLSGLARELGYRTGAALFTALGPWALLVGLVLAGVALAVLWRRSRRRATTSRRRTR